MTEYICSSCGNKNLKLWRDPNKKKSSLKCAACLGYNDVDKEGKIFSKLGSKTDKLGQWIPAIPINSKDIDEGGYWGYLSIPEDQAKWWRSLRVYDQ